MGFVDIHHHLIYGIDDGPETMDEMYAMLRMAKNNNVETIVATSHYMPGVRPFDMDLYRERLLEAHAYCMMNSMDIEILPGAEILYDPAITPQYLVDNLPTLGATYCVLLEFSPEIRFADLEGAVKGISSLGYVPVLAHIERYRCLVNKLTNVYLLKERYRVLYQVNVSTLIRTKTLFTKMFIKRLLGDEMIDLIATDAHNLSSRPCNMKEAYDFLTKLYDKEYADELTGRNGKCVLFHYV